MRAIILLVIGLAVGAMCATYAANTVAARHAYTRGVMAIMQHHATALGAQVKAGQCPADTSLDHLRRINGTAAEIESAFAGADADFFKHAHALADASAAVIASPPADCPALKQAMAKVGETCKSCHELYR
ncbi:cytochrome c [Pinirhizobacter sp.]|jgi:cytochrome c556|uniref:cytochrome c n=1 Tax=Pinirhizobacter sp. TaxID=2950432 RepID=UPI002F42F457